MTASQSITEPDGRFEITNINRVRRHTERAHYDRASVFGILDRATVAHVAFVMDGRPMVIPMAYGRIGERIYLHGARKSRITTAPSGEAVCISVTLVDGFVVARSAFDSSMNYRAVVIHGTAHEVEDEAERLRALECITDHLVPGRWSEVRGPTAQELKATSVLAVEIETASAKVRAGGVIDSPENDQRTWAGVVPVASVLGAPLTDASVPADVPVPASVQRMCGPA